MRKTKVFSGSSHPELSMLITRKLGITSGPVHLKIFANRETSVDLIESVRNQDVFIIQSGSETVNDHLMELLIMVKACKSASAQRVTAVMPYFPYSKQSKKKKIRGSITAKLVADMLVVAGVDHVITMDLHSSQIQGFFDKPTDNLFAEPSIAKYIREHVVGYEFGVVVSKNAGGAKRVTSLADRLHLDFALIHRDDAYKSRGLVNGGESNDSMDLLSQERLDAPFKKGVVAGAIGLTLVGNVVDRIVFILDDVIDSTSSFIDAAEQLISGGAKSVYVIATHGILSGNALAEIGACSSIHKIIVTNTYPIPEWKKRITSKLDIIDISGVLSEAIRRTHNGESISYLFNASVV